MSQAIIDIRQILDQFEEGLITEKECMGNVVLVASERYGAIKPDTDENPAIPFTPETE